MKINKGDTALVTGASSGIGSAFAMALSNLGVRPILVARSEEKLQVIASLIRENNGIEAIVVPADLSRSGASEDVYRTVRESGLAVDLLINNAGLGQHGRFADSDRLKQDEMVLLNSLAVVDLTRVFLPDMIQRGRGVVVNVASTAGLQPVPFMAVYGATKSFVLSFSEAVAEEVRGTGVLVQALLPGNTETPFHGKVGERDGRVGSARTPEQVVASCLRGVERDKVVVIDGPSNQVLSLVAKFSTRGMARRITANLMRKGL